MKLHNPLDEILNNQAKVKILRFLCKTEAELSGRQIAKEIKVSPAACHKALRALNNEGVLFLRSMGKSYLYCLNETNFIASYLLKPLYKKESRILNEIYSSIIKSLGTSITKKIVSLAIFGSIQKGVEGPKSDIDILVLVKKKRDKVKVEKGFEKTSKEIISKFGNTLSPYIQTIMEFKLKHKKNLPLIKNILKFHKLLFGTPLKDLT